MSIPLPLVLILLGCTSLALVREGVAVDKNPAHPAPEKYTGMCDASAAVPISDGRFIVANDEDNVLRIYDANKGGPPLSSVNLSPHLGEGEADIEGATRVGDRIYWIASHGRSKTGKRRSARQTFFATSVHTDAAGRVSVQPHATPYRGLVRDLVESDNPAIIALELDKATRNNLVKDPSLAPKKAGLNVEALASDTKGKSILIGLRNPRPGGKAILIPLLNAARVIDAQEPEQAEFGEPIYLDIGGRGIRSLEYSREHATYLLIAGSHANENVSALYRWDGSQEDAPVLVSSLSELNPEAILVYAGSKTVQLLSDDGNVAVVEDGRGKKCKDLRDPGRMSFRSTRIEVPVTG